MNTYIHKTNQRLRVRSDFIKSNPQDVLELIEQLDEIDAIHKITYRKHAGSVAICFDQKELDCDSVLEIVESHGWTKSSEKPLFIEKAMVSGTKTLVKGLTGVALSRLVGPSVSRVLMNLA
ncbi:HMA2 domain-containing protein [Vibrio sonorensis]|uniref:HMA2 domain-containing protein n=1 Tax=Vibrio sonorensis TaxID=1004316 RepID=UPI0008DA2380|nr:hypothetical protein [Vibrio sonorensis]